MAHLQEIWHEGVSWNPNDRKNTRSDYHDNGCQGKKMNIVINIVVHQPGGVTIYSHPGQTTIKTPINCCPLPWSQMPTDHRQTDTFLWTYNNCLHTENQGRMVTWFSRESTNKQTDRQTNATKCIISQLRGR